MPDSSNPDEFVTKKPGPVVMKGVPLAGQAEKLIKVRREITQSDHMTRMEQIEHVAVEKAGEILNAAKSEAEALISKAKGEAEGIRSKAHSDGDLAAKREALEKIQSLITELEKDINTIREVRSDFLKHNLEGVIDLACALAAKVIVSELNTRPEMIAQRARELLDRMPPVTSVVLTASQEDIDVIQTYLTDIGGPDDMFKTSLRSDPGLKSGCLRLESDSGRIDARLLDVLEEIGSILKEQACQISDAGNIPMQETKDDG